MMMEMLISLFLMGVGIFLLYFMRLRDYALAYPIIASVIFLANVIYSASIPFSTNNGEIVGIVGNYILIGLNLIFFVVALMYSIKGAFSLFGR